MSIESKIPTEEINIKNLRVEEPEDQAGLPFDVKKNLPEEDWQDFTVSNQKLDTGWNTIRLRILASLRANLKIANESRELPELKVYTCEVQLKELNKLVDSYISSPTKEAANEALSLGESVVIQFPGQTQQVKEVLGPIIPILKTNLLNYEFESSLYILSRFVLLFPEERQNLNLEDKKERFLASLELARHNNTGLGDKATYFYFLKIIYPELYNSFKPGEQDWINMQADFKKARQQRMDETMATMVAKMKLLQAESIEITNEGFKYAMPKPESNLAPKTTIPEIKKF